MISDRSRKSQVYRGSRSYPVWFERQDDVNLREVGPGLFVGAENSPFYPKQWSLVVDFYGTMLENASGYRRAEQRVSLPFLDGASFPPGTLDALYYLTRSAIKRGPVLFHCQAGVSRSASAAYAMLRALGGLSHEQALGQVKTRHVGFPRTETLRSAREWLRRRF